MANIHQFTFNLFHEHTMILTAESGECVVVDPGFYTDAEKRQFYSHIEEARVTPKAILVTHCHIDHVWGAKDIQNKFGIPVYMGPEGKEMFANLGKTSERLGLRAPDSRMDVTHVGDGDMIDAAGFRFKVITTPGHSPGGVCYLEEREKTMFTGDTLFAGTIGRTDLFGGDYDSLIKSIMEKLVWLDPDIVIYPGHGPCSTIGRERTQNPFLEPFNEKEELEWITSEEKS